MMSPVLFVSIWLALVLFVAGEAGKRFGGSAGRLARVAWLAGAALCAVHMALAFFGVHRGSHASVVAETARQTAAVYGVAWGGGAYVNYAFLIAWTGEAIWWHVDPPGYHARPRWIMWLGRTLFFVVLFNAAVVFAGMPGRIVGILLSAALSYDWIVNTRRAPPVGATLTR